MKNTLLSLLLLLVSPSWCATTGVIADATLLNQNGKKFTVHSLKGKYIFASFVYSQCPQATMCPLTMKLNRQVQALWTKNFPKTPFHLLIVTLDPRNDSPAVLKSYGTQHHLDLKNSTLATGTPKALEDFAADFNVIGWPNEGRITHNLKSILIGPDLKPIKEYKENEWAPEQVIEDFKKLSEAKG